MIAAGTCIACICELHLHALEGGLTFGGQAVMIAGCILDLSSAVDALFFALRVSCSSFVSGDQGCLCSKV
jgi:hypothetical protein